MTDGLGYLRVSGKTQVGPDKDGFERQALAIEAYAKAHDITVTTYYFEPGVSGTTEGEDRLAWVALMQALQTNCVRTVIVEKLDRLARDLMVQEHIIVDIKARGIDLRSACEPDLCSNDPTRVLMRHIMGAISQYDKAMIVVKLACARKRIRDRGERCDGQPPYGTRAGEEDVLKLILALHRESKSLSAISATLNERGIKPRKKRSQWYPQTVKRAIERHKAGRKKKA